MWTCLTTAINVSISNDNHYCEHVLSWFIIYINAFILHVLPPPYKIHIISCCLLPCVQNTLETTYINATMSEKLELEWMCIFLYN